MEGHPRCGLGRLIFADTISEGRDGGQAGFEIVLRCARVTLVARTPRHFKGGRWVNPAAGRP